jgi:superfamily II DNA or RNA helicase
MLSTVQKGTLYEVFIQNYLEKQNLNNNYWLWKDVPELELRKASILGEWNTYRFNRKRNNQIAKEENKLIDTGCDILAKINDEYIIIQCKNYDENNYVTVLDLAGFYMMISHYELNGIVYYTSKLSPNITSQKQIEKIKYIKKIFNNNQIENDNNDNDNENKIKNNLIANARDYQIDAVNKINSVFSTKKRAILQLPCGLGKTLISMMVGLNYEQIVIFSPLKQYCIQNLDRYLSESKYSKYKSLIIDSDETRDIDVITEFIKKNNKFILSVCFKSVDVIMKIIDKLNNPIFIIDEWHNISKNDIILSEEYPMSNLLYSDSRILFMSATPKIYDVEDDELNEELFGEIEYSYNMGTAITNGLICDYEIYLPDIQVNNNIFIQNIDEEINLSIYAINSNDLVIKSNFIMRGLLETGARKCIMYVRTHEEAEEYKKILIKLNEYFSVDLLVNTILSKDNKESRINKIKSFTLFNGFSILINVEILNECIDVKECDSIFFTYCSNSKIKNIQRISRSNRKDDKNKNKISKIFLWASEYEDTIDILTHLKEFDNSFMIEKVKIFNINNNEEQILERSKNSLKYKILEDYILNIKVAYNWDEKYNLLINYIKENNSLPSKASPDKDISLIGKFYQYQNYNYGKKLKMMKHPKYYNIWTEFLSKNDEYFVSHEQAWIRKLNIAKDFIKQNKRLPSKYTDEEKEKKIGVWISLQKNQGKYGTKLLSDDHPEIKTLWNNFLEENKKLFLNNNDKWYDILDDLKKYISENNKLPSCHSKEENTKFLGNWILTQKKNAKNKTQIMADEDVFNTWSEFCQENAELLLSKEELWINNLNKLEKFIDINRKRPSKHSSNNDEKSLGNWLIHQVQYLKANTNSMKNEELRKSFTEFTQKYNEYI